MKYLTRKHLGPKLNKAKYDVELYLTILCMVPCQWGFNWIMISEVVATNWKNELKHIAACKSVAEEKEKYKQASKDNIVKIYVSLDNNCLRILPLTVLELGK